MSAHSLTERHRLAQLDLRKITVAQLVRLWPMLNLTALDDTFPAFALAVGGMVGQQRQISAALAKAYLTQYRSTLEVPGALPVVAVPALDAARLVGNLRITSVVSVKAAVSIGTPLQAAGTAALVRAAGAASRLALEGGREVLVEAARADPAAKGWRRVASPAACDFCLMLAGRERLYHSKETASRAHDGDRYHDHCGCAAEVVY